MKTKLILTFFICASAVVFNSCKKDDNTSSPTPSTPTGTTGSLTAKINGQPYTATSTLNTLLGVTSVGQSRLDLRGTNATHGLIITTADGDTDDEMLPGTYVFDDMNDGALLTYYTITPGGGTLSEHILSEATVRITLSNRATKKVSGTFSGKMFKATNDTDTLYITDGVFTDLTYTYAKQ